MVILKRFAVLAVLGALASGAVLGAGRYGWPRQEAPDPGEGRFPSAAELRLLAAAAAELCDSSVRAAAARTEARAAERLSARRIEMALSPEFDEPGLLGEELPLPVEAWTGKDGSDLAGLVEEAAKELRRSLSRLEIPAGVRLRVTHPACGQVLTFPEGPGGDGATDATGPRGGRRFLAVSELGWQVVAEAGPVAAARETGAALTGREKVAAWGAAAAAAAVVAAAFLAARRAPTAGSAAGWAARARAAAGEVPTGSILRLRERYGASPAGSPRLAERTRSPILRRLLAEVGRGE